MMHLSPMAVVNSTELHVRGVERFESMLAP